VVWSASFIFIGTQAAGACRVGAGLDDATRDGIVHCRGIVDGSAPPAAERWRRPDEVFVNGISVYRFSGVIQSLRAVFIPEANSSLISPYQRPHRPGAQGTAAHGRPESRPGVDRAAMAIQQ
jgi:hypothetical protein